MRLACSTGSFPEDRWETALAKVAWAGFEAIELQICAEPMPEGDELMRRIRANELEVAALFAGPAPATSSAEAELARIGRVCVLARTLDAPLVVLEPPSIQSSSSREHFAEALHLLDHALGDMAVDLCLVNRLGSVLGVPSDFRSLWSRGLPSRVSIALDPGEAWLAGWSPLELDSLPALPRHTYLTDATGDRRVPPGEGSVDHGALASSLRVRGYTGSVCLLLQNADPWAVEPIARETREIASVWFA